MSARSRGAVILVMAIFFVISFITNVMGPIFPALVRDYDISLAVAGLFPFAFFIAYGVMSIPAGMLTEIAGAKKTLLIAFFLSSIGALLLVFFHELIAFMVSLFLIGAAMAMLQVVINPLLRVAGGEENFAFNSVAAQLMFGGAATVSPLVYTYLVGSLSSSGNDWVSIIFAWVPKSFLWISMYGIFFLVSLFMFVLVLSMRLPKVELSESETAGALQTHIDLFKLKTVKLFFLAILCYVASEQGVANSISLFLARYHGLNPDVEGAKIVSQFWLMMVVGCVLGLGLLRVFDSRFVLKAFSAAAIICYLTALFSSSKIAVVAFPVVGFCLSVMFSIIFSLALNSLSSHHGSFAGILCSGILGGAIISPVIGIIADFFGDLRMGMLFVLVTLFYIFCVGFWAKPLINNKTWRSVNVEN